MGGWGEGRGAKTGRHRHSGWPARVLPLPSFPPPPPPPPLSLSLEPRVRSHRTLNSRGLDKGSMPLVHSPEIECSRPSPDGSLATRTKTKTPFSPPGWLDGWPLHNKGRYGYASSFSGGLHGVVCLEREGMGRECLFFFFFPFLSFLFFSFLSA